MWEIKIERNSGKTLGVIDIEGKRWGIWRKQEWEMGGHWEERETGIGERAEIGEKDGDGERVEGDRLGTEMCICLHLCERETHTEYVCVRRLKQAETSLWSLS